MTIVHRAAIRFACVAPRMDFRKVKGLDKQMSHLHYIETREDCRRRGVASRLWAKVREEAAHAEVTASADTDDGKRRLRAN